MPNAAPEAFIIHYFKSVCDSQGALAETRYIGTLAKQLSERAEFCLTSF